MENKPYVYRVALTPRCSVWNIEKHERLTSTWVLIQRRGGDGSLRPYSPDLPCDAAQRPCGVVVPLLSALLS